MTTLLSNFVEKIQTKHWKNLRRRTQKLDPEEKGNLLELLEDNLSAPTMQQQQQQQDTTESADSAASGNNNNNNNDSDDDEFAEEDYELLQRDLDRANLRLEELQSKHDFLRTRLETYRAKIQAAEDRCSSSNANADMANQKIASYKEALKPVEATFQTLSRELELHQRKIESMQDRQLDLKLKTQECQVVLDELCHGMEVSARLPFEDHDQEIVAQIQDDEKEEGTPLSSCRSEDVEENGGDENDKEEEP